MYRVVSLYSGAGGLDIGFLKAGFDIIWANDFDKNACETYRTNIGDHIRCGDIKNYFSELENLKNVDVVIGGPPCQGFSVAGKMDPNDHRSRQVWNFVEVVRLLKPNVFVMENVKALGELKKWRLVRESILDTFRELGYSSDFIVLNASDFDVPQSRERVFFIGFKSDDSTAIPNLGELMSPFKKKGTTVRDALKILDRAGTGNNKGVCKAKITLAHNPILRKSPYAGMLFNGLGRPTKLYGYSATLPASMGGNKTPIIDESELYEGNRSWVEQYHDQLTKHGNMETPPKVPSFLRRMTVQEAALIQTFPYGYTFSGPQSSQFKQIGNAVPCNLAKAVGKMIYEHLKNNQP